MYYVGGSFAVQPLGIAAFDAAGRYLKPFGLSVAPQARSGSLAWRHFDFAASRLRSVRTADLSSRQKLRTAQDQRDHRAQARFRVVRLEARRVPNVGRQVECLGRQRVLAQKISCGIVYIGRTVAENAVAPQAGDV